MKKFLSAVALSIVMALDAGALVHVHAEDRSPASMRVLRVSGIPSIIELTLDLRDSMGPYDDAIVETVVDFFVELEPR